MFKARIKILVESMGAGAFTEAVEETFAQLKNGKLTLPIEEIDRVTAFFPPPSADRRPESISADAAFLRWTERNVKPHKVAGLRSVVVSLKPHGKTPGDASAEQMDVLADLAERYAGGELRVTKEQNLVLPHVAAADLGALYTGLAEAGLATANAGLASDIVSCPGLDYCNLANARSIPLAQDISRRLEESGLDEAAGELTIKISGCINACGHHHVANIGLLGVDKKGEEFYQLTLGGVGDGQAAVGRILGPALKADDAVAAVLDVVRLYQTRRADGETFIETLGRIGADPFKRKVYAD